MQRIWLVEDQWEMGGIGTSWKQSWGLSQNKRTGVWTFYDRRDGRNNHDGWGEMGYKFRTVAELEPLISETGWDLEEFAHVLKGIDIYVVQELRLAILREIDGEDDDPEDDGDEPDPPGSGFGPQADEPTFEQPAVRVA